MKPEKGEGPPVNKEAFQRLIGKLIYLNHTRLDISFVVSSLCQFMNEPCENHLQAAHWVLAYLKNAIEGGLLFKQNGDLSMEAYSDADYAS